MGLDVCVFKAIIPADKLDTIEKVAAFESKNECSFHTTEIKKGVPKWREKTFIKIIQSVTFSK